VTELVVALGLRPYLVGRTRYCIHPSAVLVDVPKVGGTKYVRVERVRALTPTHVIVNADENHRETVDALRDEFEAELALTQARGWTPREVLYLIWRDPWMTITRDTYISSMLVTVNWHTLPALEGGATGAARYPLVDAGAPWLAGVERILLSSEPYPFAPRDVEAAQQLAPRASVECIDGELVSWYGPRAATGLRYLRRLAAHE